MQNCVSGNLQRLLAAAGLSIEGLAEQTGLDKRTIQGILHGRTRAHPRTVQRLAAGLQVSPDEFFLDPARLLYRHFDCHTNPLVDEILQSHGHLFDDWTAADFEELHSRVGTGGGLTRDGALAAVEKMNRKRELFQKLSLLLESNLADSIGRIIDTLCQEARSLAVHVQNEGGSTGAEHRPSVDPRHEDPQPGVWG